MLLQAVNFSTSRTLAMPDRVVRVAVGDDAAIAARTERRRPSTPYPLCR